MTRSRWVRVSALLCTGVLAIAACGGDDDDDAATTEAATTEAAPVETEAAPVETEAAPVETEAAPVETEAAPVETEAPEDPLGEANPATGEPLKVVWMWSGVSPAVDNSADLASAKAVTQWINEYGGGIGAEGRELELIDCSTNSDAAVAAACGSTIVDSGASAVLMNVVGEIEPWATPTLAAGIPIFAYSTADAAVRGAPDLVFTMSNPVAGIAYAPAALAKEFGVTKSTIVVIDVPAASGPAAALGPLVFGQVGAGEVTVLPISPTATDHNADIQAELQANNPGLVSIIGNPAFCSLTIRALRDAGYEGIIAGISNCIDAAAKEQLGSDLEGVYVSYSAGEDPTDPSYATYLNIVAKYDPELVPNGTPVGAFVALESFRRVMADYAGDYTPASIAAHIRAHEAVDLPTVTGKQFKCDSQALPIIPVACTSAFAYSQLDAEGNPTEFIGASA